MNQIAVLGAGTMGQGIAWALAAAGKEVILFDIYLEYCERAVKSITKSLAKQEEKSKAGTVDAVTGRTSAW
ncbi:MAG: hypothetical protein GXZ09_09325 [Syntrophomonadaceae bacterium]|nr:hypothetical protein [Syntrophomonadaceae bacterium]